jgi:hypothetical protein
VASAVALLVAAVVDGLSDEAGSGSARIFPSVAARCAPF